MQKVSWGTTVAYHDFFFDSFDEDSYILNNLNHITGTLLLQNMSPDYRYHDGVSHNFFSVFAIFFPAGKFCYF